MFGVSPRPFTVSPVSVSAVALVRLFCAVQLFDAAGDDWPSGVLPGAVADTAARLHRTLTTVAWVLR